MATRSGKETSTREMELAYWRAVAMLRFDRPRGLSELERCFSAGRAPSHMDGPYAGRVVATTFGRGLDGPFEAVAGQWMPWKGKTLNAAAAEGRNIFTTGGRRAVRMVWPGYAGVRHDSPDRSTAFRFVTDVGKSETSPGVDVLRIDYRDLEENPSWPIRRILDELVEVGDGLYLGQALLYLRGSFHRAAWFSLEG